MKKLLLKLVRFSIPIFILVYPLDFLISFVIKQNRSYAEGEIGVWEDIFNSKINSNILVYGSSRAWVHINSSMIQDSLKTTCYNLGINGHNFWLQYLRHIEYLKYNSKPKTIIFSVDAFSFEKRTELFNYIQFLPYIKNNNIVKYTSSYKGFSTLDYHLPLWRYFGEWRIILRSFFNFLNISEIEEHRVLGYRGKNRKWNTKHIDKANAKKSYKPNIDSISVDLFKQFLTECNKNEIEVILVYTPMYIDGQKFIKNHNKLIALYREIANNFNIKFFNYLDNEICERKTFFYNSMHLNKSGAELFTKILIEDLREYKK